ncbi:MAG TPA: tyrosine-protein phosphatase [Candidatus Limnocylindria bacterium]
MAADARVLRWDALLNARDLGGLPSARGPIARGAVVRSDALHRLSEAGRAALVAHGVRTVIDMRDISEVEARPYAFPLTSGVTYRHVGQQSQEMWKSTRGRDRVTRETMMLELARSRLAAIAEVIADAPAGGVLIHCEAGKDRTGLMTMLLLDLVGTPADVIAADYTLTAIGLAPLFSELLAKAENDTPERRAWLEEDARSRPEVMLAIHAVLRDRYGGAEPYLLGAGASAASLERIRGRMQGGSRASPTT